MEQHHARNVLFDTIWLQEKPKMANNERKREPNWDLFFFDEWEKWRTPTKLRINSLCVRVCILLCFFFHCHLFSFLENIPFNIFFVLRNTQLIGRVFHFPIVILCCWFFLILYLPSPFFHSFADRTCIAKHYKSLALIWFSASFMRIPLENETQIYTGVCPCATPTQ